jgi:hypothetical protein
MILQEINEEIFKFVLMPPKLRLMGFKASEKVNEEGF